MVVKTDAQVVADLGVMAPLHRIAFARVRMLVHIVLRRQTDILALLHAGRASPKSWMRAVEADLVWVAAATPNTCGIEAGVDA